MTDLGEAICIEIAAAGEIVGLPGYVRAYQVREHLLSKPSHDIAFLEMLPAVMQGQIQARLSRQETRLLRRRVAA